MIGLDRLMDRRGVLAVGQFSSEGKVLRTAGNLSTEEMEKVALACAAHEKASWIIATELRESTSLNWGNLNGWVLWAGNLALCVSGNTGVFVDAPKADFNQLMVDLFGPPSGEHPRILTNVPGARSGISTTQDGETETGTMKQTEELNFEEYDFSNTDTHKPARPMRFFKDNDGCGWLCDKDVDPDRDLEARVAGVAMRWPSPWEDADRS